MESFFFIKSIFLKEKPPIIQEKSSGDVFVPRIGTPWPESPNPEFDPEKYGDFQEGSYPWMVSNKLPDGYVHVQWMWSKEPKLDVSFSEDSDPAESLKTVVQKLKNLGISLEENKKL